MTASPSELSLECKPHSYSMLLKSFGEQSEQTQKLEDFLSRLEAERVKIDAFKRELPLCMQLLTNAMEASRQQLQSYLVNRGPQVPVLEEFISIKHSSSPSTEKASNKSDNKANWMTSAQLWNEASDATKQLQQRSNIIRSTTPSKENEICFNVRKGGAFLPFSKEREREREKERERVAFLPDHLGLASAHKEVVEDKKLICENNTEMNGILSTMEIGCERTSNTINGAEAIQQVKAETQTATSTAHQTHRKARRCWSPDLHRRFVNALQMLGGSQVATPKQIRELMKVEGLTNDEVKSHLQKYRLHTRRPTPTPQAAGTPAPHLVVFGGIWVPPEYATAAAAAHGGGAPALYGAAHASPHYCGPPLPQEFYHAPPQPQYHNLHSQLDLYKASSSRTHSSPESDVRAAENRTKSRDDSKSESSNWKDNDGSNENDGERRGLARLREQDDQDSNGSKITLKV